MNAIMANATNAAGMTLIAASVPTPEPASSALVAAGAVLLMLATAYSIAWWMEIRRKEKELEPFVNRKKNT